MYTSYLAQGVFLCIKYCASMMKLVGIDEWDVCIGCTHHVITVPLDETVCHASKASVNFNLTSFVLFYWQKLDCLWVFQYIKLQKLVTMLNLKIKWLNSVFIYSPLCFFKLTCPRHMCLIWNKKGLVSRTSKLLSSL